MTLLQKEINERIQAEENLLKLNKAVNNSKEVIFMTNKEGVFTFVNSRFTEMYGFTAKEVIGEKTPRILKSDFLDQAQYQEFWGSILKSKPFLHNT